MRLLRVLCNDRDPDESDALKSAVAAFNRGLDIRLRFLSIGIDDCEVLVDDAPDAALLVERAMKEHGADAVLVIGSGDAAVAAATVAVRSVPVVAHWDAGRRDGDTADAARAVDHLATVLLVRSDASADVLREEGLAQRVAHVGTPDGPGFGREVINALRAARTRTSGDSPC